MALDKNKLKKMYEDYKKAHGDYVDKLYKCLHYIEQEQGFRDPKCVDAEVSPNLYTFEQFCEKEGISFK